MASTSKIISLAVVIFAVISMVLAFPQAPSPAAAGEKGDLKQASSYGFGYYGGYPYASAYSGLYGYGYGYPYYGGYYGGYGYGYPLYG